MSDLEAINNEQVATEIETMLESTAFRVFRYVMTRSVNKARVQLEDLGAPGMSAEQIGLHHMYWKGWGDCGKQWETDLPGISNAVRAGGIDWRKALIGP